VAAFCRTWGPGKRGGETAASRLAGKNRRPVPRPRRGGLAAFAHQGSNRDARKERVGEVNNHKAARATATTSRSLVPWEGSGVAGRGRGKHHGPPVIRAGRAAPLRRGGEVFQDRPRNQGGVPNGMLGRFFEFSAATPSLPVGRDDNNPIIVWPRVICDGSEAGRALLRYTHDGMGRADLPSTRTDTRTGRPSPSEGPGGAGAVAFLFSPFGASVTRIDKDAARHGEKRCPGGYGRLRRENHHYGGGATDGFQG